MELLNVPEINDDPLSPVWLEKALARFAILKVSDVLRQTLAGAKEKIGPAQFPPPFDYEHFLKMVDQVMSSKQGIEEQMRDLIYEIESRIDRASARDPIVYENHIKTANNIIDQAREWLS